MSTKENRAGPEAGADDGAVAVGGIAPHENLADSASGAGGTDRLGHHRGRAFPGAASSGAQADTGDHRCAMLGTDRGDQRGQTAAQHLLAGDLREPETGTLLAMPEYWAQQRVDVDERPLPYTRQQGAVPDEVH
jgi:hypothetical protein